MATHKILSTKKLEPPLVRQAKQDGIEIIEQEFISVNPIYTKQNLEKILQLAMTEANVVFTSANAVTTVDRYLHRNDACHVTNWKTFCISGKTKKALQQALCLQKNSIADAEYGADLAKKIIEKNVNEVTHFCGNKRREEISSILTKAGVTVQEIVVYETIETPTRTIEDVEAVLFFSPSAVRSFFTINQLKKETICFAIGQTTANTIMDFVDNKIITSEYPSQEILLDSVKFYFQN